MSNPEWAVSEDEAFEFVDQSYLPEHLRVTVKPHEEKTVVGQLRQQFSSFLKENQGVALMAIASYATARGTGRTHEQSMEYAGIAWKHGKEVERLYVWFANKIAG